MKADWTPLRTALASCRRNDVPVPIWWRDDDAISPSKTLEQLHKLSSALNVPVHIAVIPGRANRDLATLVSTSSTLVPMVHGWRHTNHAAAGQKKAEFGSVDNTRRAELKDALSRMNDLFGEGYLRVFVPPWNRIDPDFFDLLSSLGYRGLSTFSARTHRFAAPGLLQINTHLDPIDWHGTRGLLDPDALIAQTAEILTRRLREETDQTEPLGYLTHHLVHTSELWDFSERLIGELLDGGASVQPINDLLEATI